MRPCDVTMCRIKFLREIQMKKIFLLCSIFLASSLLAEGVDGKKQAKPEGHMGRLMHMADMDKNGMLSEQEIESFVEKISKKVNDPSKLAVLSEKIKKMAEGHRKAILEKFDLDGDGQLSGSERGDFIGQLTERHDFHRKKMLERFDADGDGELSEAERKKSREQMKRRGHAHCMNPEKRKAMMEKFDLDGDGKLSESEHQNLRTEMKKRKPFAKGVIHDEAKRKELFKKFDLDGDGQLNEMELQQARGAHMKKHHGPKDADRHKEMLKRFDTDGDGQLSESEREHARESKKTQILERFDEDGDGELSEQERAKAREAKPDKRKGEGRGKKAPQSEQAK